MLDGKNVEQTDSMFPFVAALADRKRDEQKRHRTTPVHTNLLELQKLLNGKNARRVQPPQFPNRIQHRIEKYRSFVKDTLDTYCTPGLHTLMFNLLDKVIEDLNRLGFLKLLSSLVSKPCNIHARRTQHSTSRRWTSASEEMPPAVDMNTGIIGKELHKTQMTVRSIVSDKLARTDSTGLFRMMGDF